eukprot:2747450-Prymnesium_polylepis.1
MLRRAIVRSRGYLSVVRAVVLKGSMHLAGDCVQRLAQVELPCALGRVTQLVRHDEAEGAHDAKRNENARTAQAVCVITAVATQRDHVDYKMDGNVRDKKVFAIHRDAGLDTGHLLRGCLPIFAQQKLEPRNANQHK